MSDDNVVPLRRWQDFNDAEPQREALPQDAAGELKARLLGQLQAVLGYLLPAGVVRHGKFQIGDVRGNPGDSLEIELSGPKAGQWYDFATGEGGDILALWATALGMDTRRDFPAVLTDVRQWLDGRPRTRHDDRVPPTPPRKRQPMDELGPPTGKWHYNDASGTLIAVVYRYDLPDGSKEFRPWDVAARKHRAPTPRPLYNQPGIKSSINSDGFVVLVEGEKCADALIRAGICATTAMGGSNAPPEKTDWSPLAGAHVLIWPDNDAPGAKYAAAAAHGAQTAGASSVAILTQPTGQPEGWDAADAADEGLDLMNLLKGWPREALPAAPLPPTKPCTTFEWVDPATIPPRQWLYGRHLIRKFVSVTVAPGGVGKSSLAIVEALAMATGRPLLGVAVPQPLRVWYLNLEDPREELTRRFVAAMQHYQIDDDAIGGRLFVDDGRGTQICTAIARRDGATVIQPEVDMLIATIRQRRLDVSIIDPFVATHQASENDNAGMDVVAKTWNAIADETDSAIELVHHARKQSGGEITSDSARGASSLIASARDARALNRMTAAQAKELNITNAGVYFRTFSDKANMAPPADKSTWYQIRSIALANADYVGVVTAWEWPDLFGAITGQHVLTCQQLIAGKGYRADPRSEDWIGLRIAEALNIDPNRDRKTLAKIIRTWLANGALIEVEVKDGQRRPRKCIDVGQWATSTDS